MKKELEKKRGQGLYKNIKMMGIKAIEWKADGMRTLDKSWRMNKIMIAG